MTYNSFLTTAFFIMENLLKWVKCAKQSEMSSINNIKSWISITMLYDFSNEHKDAFISPLILNRILTISHYTCIDVYQTQK